MKKISHSAWNKFHTCPRLYKLHYIDRLRPKDGSSSALLFGIAVDEALNALLLKTGDPLKVFQESFTWDKCKGTKWFDADYDPDLLSLEQVRELTGKSKEYVTWACMRIKGRLLIEKYIEEIYPLIEEVHHVQLETTRPGFIDAIVSIRGHGVVLLDNKTSSQFYKRDAVKSSSQLALYAGQVGVRKAGFAVLSKNINKNKVKVCKSCGYTTSTAHKTCNNILEGKRCHGTFDISVSPSAVVQLIIDDIDVDEQKVIEASVKDTEKAIDAGCFPMNVGACHNMYGKPCAYFNYCRTNDKKGLEIKPEMDYTKNKK